MKFVGPWTQKKNQNMRLKRKKKKGRKTRKRAKYKRAVYPNRTYVSPITICNVFFFFFSRFRCIWFILICLTFRVRWIFVSKNICSTCANNCMPSVYTFLNGVITPLSLKFWGNDTPPQTWRLRLVEWKGGEKRKQKDKGEEKEWGKNINVISQKKSKPFKF